MFGMHGVKSWWVLCVKPRYVTRPLFGNDKVTMFEWVFAIFSAHPEQPMGAMQVQKAKKASRNQLLIHHHHLCFATVLLFSYIKMCFSLLDEYVRVVSFIKLKLETFPIKELAIINTTAVEFTHWVFFPYDHKLHDGMMGVN